MANRLKPRSISATDELWTHVKEEAERAGMSISRWVRGAVVRELEDAGDYDLIPGPVEPWPDQTFPVVTDRPLDPV